MGSSGFVAGVPNEYPEEAGLESSGFVGEALGVPNKYPEEAVLGSSGFVAGALGVPNEITEEAGGGAKEDPSAGVALVAPNEATGLASVLGGGTPKEKPAPGAPKENPAEVIFPGSEVEGALGGGFGAPG